MHLVAVSETWLNDTISDSFLLNGNNYTVYRKDRMSRGGGVCLFVVNPILSNRVTMSECYKDLEIVAIDIHVGECKFRVISCYKAPAVSVSCVQSLCNCINSLCNVTFPIIMCGDFNFPTINWSLAPSDHKSCEGMFYDCITHNSLCQCINVPTYINSNHVLDLLFVSDPLSLVGVNVGTPFDISDHASVMFSLSVLKEQDVKIIRVKSFTQI
jgi:hypothetical protein